MNDELTLIDHLYEEPNVRFIYEKKDGTIRDAEGTRQKGYFDGFWDSARQVRTYWDNEKGDYRCFKEGNLLMEIRDDSVSLAPLIGAAMGLFAVIADDRQKENERLEAEKERQRKAEEERIKEWKKIFPDYDRW